MQYSQENRSLKKFTHYAFYFCTALLIHSVAHADNTPNEQFGYFTHKDWEIACDNTLTCRAVGYNAEENASGLVAIQLERKAGPNASIAVSLNFLDEDDTYSFDNFYIDGKDEGAIVESVTDKDYSTLSAKQTDKLLKALANSQKIEFGSETNKIELSSAGSNAVLLKMDEVQGRINTPSALIKKGNKPNSTVYPPIPKPKYTIPKRPSLSEAERQADREWITANLSKLNQLLTEALSAQSEENNYYLNECEVSEQDESQQNMISSQRIDESTFALEKPCWLAAYNSGSVLWTIDQKTMQVKQIVTTASSGQWSYDENEIDLSSVIVSHKSRGIGDCWSVEHFVFTGEKYVPSYIMNNQLCRGFAGGAFQLPTFVSDVVDLNRK